MGSLGILREKEKEAFLRTGSLCHLVQVSCESVVAFRQFRVLSQDSLVGVYRSTLCKHEGSCLSPDTCHRVACLYYGQALVAACASSSSPRCSPALIRLGFTKRSPGDDCTPHPGPSPPPFNGKWTMMMTASKCDACGEGLNNSSDLRIPLVVSYRSCVCFWIFVQRPSRF